MNFNGLISLEEALSDMFFFLCHTCCNIITILAASPFKVFILELTHSTIIMVVFKCAVPSLVIEQFSSVSAPTTLFVFVVIKGLVQNVCSEQKLYLSQLQVRRNVKDCHLFEWVFVCPGGGSSIHLAFDPRHFIRITKINCLRQTKHLKTDKCRK